MGLQVAAAGKIINEFTGLAFAGGEFETDNPAIRFVSAEAWTANAQGAHITFATAPIGTSSPVEGMRLTSEGILLVGTDTASGSAKLQVNGAISVSGITYAGTLALSATGANPVTLATNGSERARITSGGNVLIGTTSDGNYKLDVAASGSSGTLRVYDQTATTGSTSLVVRAGAGQSTNNQFVLQNNGGTQLTGANNTTWRYSQYTHIFGSGVSTEDINLDLGQSRTGNGSVYIDFIGDTTYTDYGLRIIRGSAGANAASSILHRGTGALYITAEDNGAVVLSANAAEKFRINNTGIGFFGVTPVAKQIVTADAASILAALQMYGLAV